MPAGPLDCRKNVVDRRNRRKNRAARLIDLQTAGEPLLGRVLKGVKICGGATAYGALIRKHLFEEADFMPYRERILRTRRRAWTAN